MCIYALTRGEEASEEVSSSGTLELALEAMKLPRTRLG